MTDREIIKALECCTKDDCNKCPNNFGNCYSNLAGYALDLIHHKDAEIRNYIRVAEKQQKVSMDRHFVIKRLTEERNAFRHYYDECLKDLKKAHAEIERLKKENNQFTDIGKLYSEIKAESIKEFAERLKEEIVEALKSNYNAQNERILKTNKVDEFVKYCDGKIAALRGIDDFLDDLLKEMVGDSNGGDRV